MKPPIPPEIVEAVLDMLREPPVEVTTAMAEEQAAAERRNGHGRYGYRDMWVAGIDAAKRKFA
jgi:hypothetical protein